MILINLPKFDNHYCSFYSKCKDSSKHLQFSSHSIKSEKQMYVRQFSVDWTLQEVSSWKCNENWNENVAASTPN